MPKPHFAALVLKQRPEDRLQITGRTTELCPNHANPCAHVKYMRKRPIRRFVRLLRCI